jgi:hypothetical protein
VVIFSQFLAPAGSDAQPRRDPAGSEKQAVVKAPARVGQIFVVGNESTPQSLILNRVPLYPGQVLVEADMQRGEAELAKLSWFFVVTKADRPRVQVANPKSDSVFKDIIVTVRERRHTRYCWPLVDAGREIVRYALARLIFGRLASIPGAPEFAEEIACMGWHIP